MDAQINTACLVLSLGVIIGILNPRQLDEEEQIWYIFNQHFSTAAAIRTVIGESDGAHNFLREERVAFNAGDIPVYHVSKRSDQGILTQRHFKGCGKIVRIDSYDPDSLVEMENLFTLDVPEESKQDHVYRWSRVSQMCAKLSMSCAAVARDASHRLAFRRMYMDETAHVGLVIEDSMSPLLSNYWVANLAGVAAYADANLTENSEWSIMRLDVKLRNTFWENQHKVGVFLTSNVLGRSGVDEMPSAYLVQRKTLTPFNKCGPFGCNLGNEEQTWLDDIVGSDLVVLPPMFVNTLGGGAAVYNTQSFLDSLLMILLQYDRYSQFVPANIALMTEAYSVYREGNITTSHPDLPATRRSSRWSPS